MHGTYREPSISTYRVIRKPGQAHNDDGRWGRYEAIELERQQKDIKKHLSSTPTLSSWAGFREEHRQSPSIDGQQSVWASESRLPRFRLPARWSVDERVLAWRRIRSRIARTTAAHSLKFARRRGGPPAYPEEERDRSSWRWWNAGCASAEIVWVPKAWGEVTTEVRGTLWWVNFPTNFPTLSFQKRERQGWGTLVVSSRILRDCTRGLRLRIQLFNSLPIPFFYHPPAQFHTRG